MCAAVAEVMGKRARGSPQNPRSRGAATLLRTAQAAGRAGSPPAVQASVVGRGCGQPPVPHGPAQPLSQHG